MGYGVSNYVRNQMLVEKYYNNAVLDENFQLTGLMFEGALDGAIALSKDQLSAEIAVLRGHTIEPVISIGTFEATPSAIAQGPDGKFEALSGYSSGYVLARLLSYLGGWTS
jgi:hypothetical protein